MHDTLQGDIRRLLYLLLATTNILDHAKEQDLSLCEIECTNQVTADIFRKKT